MAMLITLAVFAAYGVFCALWALFGFLIPGQRGAAVVCLCKEGCDPEPLIRRYLWLYHTGLVHCPLVLVDNANTERNMSTHTSGVLHCTADELRKILELEAEHLGRTRT